MAVLITDNQNTTQISTNRIRVIAQALLSDLGSPDGELSILIVDDEDIAEINGEYFGRPWPTNVIAFSMMEGEFADVNPEAKMLGDVIISLETALREADDAMIPVEQRFTRLLIHGLLHIFGYDHETPEADAGLMEVKTESLLELLKKEKLIDY